MSKPREFWMTRGNCVFTTAQCELKDTYLVKDDEIIHTIKKEVYDELKEEFDKACDIALERKYKAQKYKAQADQLAEALEKARQLALIAADWNLCEVEINEEMVSIYDLLREFAQALAEYQGGRE